jgi:hypothetical protein
MYSVAKGVNISVQNCDISCNTNTPNKTLEMDPYLKDQTVVPMRAGAFYIQDANTLVSKDSVFHNCYQTSKGSIFYLKSV